MATIAIVGTFDTKGPELEYCRVLFEKANISTITIHSGTFPTDYPVDIQNTEVAVAGGGDMTALEEEKDRGRAMATLAQGIKSIVTSLHERGEIDAMFSLGGSGGTALATAGMRALPVGFPKVMVSTMAGGSVAEYVGTSDIIMFPSIVDVQGLNSILKDVLQNAVYATVGMLGAPAHEDDDERPHIAATMFGVTTPCITEAQKYLEERGYDVVVFHATGAGGKSMERLIDDGYFVGVLDLTTTEWCDELFGGVLAAGPHRSEAAIRNQIPQVVSVGAMDMVNFGSPETVPEKYADRTFYPHNPQVTLMRTTAAENEQLGEKLAEKLNEATTPIELLLPVRGVSAIDVEGGPFYDPEADQALFTSLRKHVRNDQVTIRELDTDINNPEFAASAAQSLIDLIESKGH